MHTVLRQALSSAESRAVSAACLTRDVQARVLDLEDLASVAELRTAPGKSVPVGSVEFVREALRVAGVTEPENFTYPDELKHLLRREVKQRRVGSVLGDWFVKPTRTKAFTGFVFDTMFDAEQYSENDREQYDIFMSLPADEIVWVAEPVQFLSEWRFYVLGEQVVGSARYDPDGADSAPVPDASVLDDAVESMRPMGLAAYAIDLGVLDSGETALVEVNDAWALGYYAGGNLHRDDYLKMLVARWDQICTTHAGRVGLLPTTA